jgi:hypothetical protein
MSSMLAYVASPELFRKIDSMTWRKRLQDSKFRPLLLGVPLALPFAVVFWALLTNRHPLGLLVIAMCIFVFGTFSFRSPVYRTICVAWILGAFLALVLWKP